MAIKIDDETGLPYRERGAPEPNYQAKRGKQPPPPVRLANIGGMGQGVNDGDLRAIVEAGKKVLDEALGS